MVTYFSQLNAVHSASSTFKAGVSKESVDSFYIWRSKKLFLHV